MTEATKNKMAAIITEEDIEKDIADLRESFNSGKTRSKEVRIRNIEAVLQMLKDHEEDICTALYQDLRKSRQETVAYEINMTKDDAEFMLLNMDEIVNPSNAHDGSLLLLGKKAFIHRDPYGLCLIIGSWNYPIQLPLMGLIGAIATGNVAILKPSELAPVTAELLEKILPDYIDSSCYRVMCGGADVAQALLRQRFDHITFTGSQRVAKMILHAAAEYLTPVTLELGGKSPVYVDKSASVSLAAKRIAWAKFLNCGQTCLAPDYVMCVPEAKSKLIDELKAHLNSFYGDDPKKSPDYGRIVNERQFERLTKLITSQEENLVFGGESDVEDKYIAPTVFDNITTDDHLMQEEIFGPLLPILTVNNEDEAIRLINSREKPLSLYVFSNDKKVRHRFMTETSSGSLMFNDLLIHYAVDTLPFGGVGHSGMGSYHGLFSVDNFSHRKACVLDPMPRQSDLTMSIRYPPYSSTKLAAVTFITRKYTKSERRLLYFLKLALVVGVLAVAVRVFEIDKMFR